MAHIAYFSAEIGFSQDVPTYAGSLGVVAGDHLKAAADAGLPLVGVTLLYRQGYVRQHIGPDGWQTESYPTFTPEPLLVRLPYFSSLTLQGRRVQVAVWRASVKGYTGQVVPILFLDTDVADNADDDRTITHRLYGGSHELRLLQEAVLGFAGLQAVQALYPQVERYHLNEVHGALAPLALLQQKKNVDAVKRVCHFTTHTAAPAAYDIYPYALAQEALGPLLPDNIRALAGGAQLSMGELALNLCGSVNGVSALHAKTLRQALPGRTIGHITHGVHHLSWASTPMAALFDRDLPGWRSDPQALARADTLAPAGLVDAHAQNKAQLLRFINADSAQGFGEDVLTVGWAGHVNAFKRPALLFRDLDRLKKLAAGKVQFVFAGKTHARDEAGHRIIQTIHEAAQALSDKIRVVYVANHSLWTSTRMTAGVDVWLNTSVRPHEACGLSGMKAALNGVPPVATNDGWWHEGARDGDNGWIIGSLASCDDDSDAAALYQTLEERIIPTYYDDKRRWAQMMQQAVVTAADFTAARMVQEYHGRYYNG